MTTTLREMLYLLLFTIVITFPVAVLAYVLGLQLLATVALVILPFFYKKQWYKWIYILYKTLPRDIKAAVRFTKMTLKLRYLDLKGYTVPELFQIYVDKHPDKTCVYFEDTQWTFRQVEELSNKIAQYFKKQGLKKGDTLSLLMESRPEYLCIKLGLCKIGVITALINTNLRKQSLIHSITVANTKALLYSSNFVEALEEVYDNLPCNIQLHQYNTKKDVSILKNSSNMVSLLKNIRSDFLKNEMVKLSPKDVVLYIYTSGTTGLPKAAVITHARYLFMVNATYYMLAIRKDDIIYDPLPLYHSAGGIIGAGQLLVNGVPVVLRSKFSASNYWKDCVKYKCTVAQYIGELCRYLLAVPPGDPSEKSHQVKKMYGNGLKMQIWNNFVERFNVKNIIEFYGATEGNSSLANIEGVPGAVGFVPRYARNFYPVTLIRCDENSEPIRNKQGFCIQCKPHEPGVLIGKIIKKKALNAFTGYTDSAATKKKILENVLKKGDRYFNSGDILVMDELGYFYFKDRTGDTFRWKGENVATTEVEAVISNILKLQDAVVYGVQVPNTDGRCGMAAIVDTKNTLNLKELAQGLRKNLPAYAYPIFLRVMKKLPMTGTFKLKKNELQADGFDVTKVEDNLYFYDSKTSEYVLLTTKLYNDITKGIIRV